MLSFRDVAGGADNADVLQTSLEELHRRRQAKQQRQQLDRDAAFAEDANPLTLTQELAYRREVLSTWARVYPRLREAVVALATDAQKSTQIGSSGSSSSASSRSPSSAVLAATKSPVIAAAASSALAVTPVFSVSDTVRRSYPEVWCIPAGTIPPAFYSDTAALQDSLPVPPPHPSSSSISSTPQRYLASASGGTNGWGVSHASSMQRGMTAIRNGGSVVRGQSSTSEWITDYSSRRCLVRVRREALRLESTKLAAVSNHSTSATAVAGWSPSTSAASLLISPTSPSLLQSPQHQSLQQHQRILARWPQGKSASTKVSAVLRSIDIEARKREQWNEHVRRQQEQHQQPGSQRTSITAETGKEEETVAHARDESPARAPGAAGAASQPSAASYSPVTAALSTELRASVARAGSISGGGPERGVPLSVEELCGRELYWPAYITNIRGVFTGAACLHDDFQGLGLLQQYERFEPVLAMALTSPLRLVVDVVYAIDETSEAFGLPIDPVVEYDTSVPGSGEPGAKPSAESSEAAAEAQVVSAARTLFLARSDPPSSTRAAEAAAASTPTAKAASQDTTSSSYPLLLPSSLPPVISDLNYSFTPAPPTHASSPPSSTSARAAAARRASAASSAAATAGALLEEPAAAVLRRSSLSTGPLSLFTILAGPVSQSHSIVLLRPTPDVVCAARARALQELEVRWQRLRQALIDRLVAYEEEAPVPVESSSEDEEEKPPFVQLPDPETYESPFLDHSAMPDDGLPEGPAEPTMLTEEEIRRQTRLPLLQGKRQPGEDSQDGVSGAASSAILKATARPADPGVSSLRAPPSAAMAGRLEGSMKSASSTATASSSSPNSQRLPARRRSQDQQPQQVPSTGGVNGLESGPHSTQPSYTPRQLPRAHSAFKDGRNGETNSNSNVDPLPRHHDDVSARASTLPRNPADPPLADLSDAALPMDTSVSRSAEEESRALSAAVRAAAARQQEAEAALRAQQKRAVAPRSELPSFVVEAPSPTSPESPIARRTSGDTQRAPSFQRQPRPSIPLDITANTSSIPKFSTLISTPPSSSLSGLPEAVVAAVAAAAAQQSSALSWDKTVSREEGSAEDGGRVMFDTSSSMEYTPASSHSVPRQRFNQRGELRIPSLSTTHANHNGAVVDDGKGSADSAHPPHKTRTDEDTLVNVSSSTTNKRNNKKASPGTSFSTPPPPAPPSHSSSPPPTNAVVHRKSRLAPAQQQQQQQQKPHEPHQQQQRPHPQQQGRQAAGPTILTPSYHGDSSSAGSMVSDEQRNEPHRYSVHDPLTEPRSAAAFVKAAPSANVVPFLNTHALQPHEQQQPHAADSHGRRELTGSSDSPTSSASDSDVPQFRSTAAFARSAIPASAGSMMKPHQCSHAARQRHPGLPAAIPVSATGTTTNSSSSQPHKEHHDAASSAPVESSPKHSSQSNSSSPAFSQRDQQQPQQLPSSAQLRGGKPLMSPRSLAASAAAAAAATAAAAAAAKLKVSKAADVSENVPHNAVNALMEVVEVNPGSSLAAAARHGRRSPGKGESGLLSRHEVVPPDGSAPAAPLRVGNAGEDGGTPPQGGSGGRNPFIDSPLPRRPSERALRRPPPQPQPLHVDAVKAATATAATMSAQQPAGAALTPMSDVASGAGASGVGGNALSSSVNREVELPGLAAATTRVAAPQRRVSGTAAAAAAAEDAELARLYHLMYQSGAKPEAEGRPAHKDAGDKAEDDVQTTPRPDAQAAHTSASHAQVPSLARRGSRMTKREDMAEALEDPSKVEAPQEQPQPQQQQPRPQRDRRVVIETPHAHTPSSPSHHHASSSADSAMSLDAVAPTALPPPRMRHTAPPTAAAATDVERPAALSGVAVSSSSQHPHSHPQQHRKRQSGDNMTQPQEHHVDVHRASPRSPSQHSVQSPHPSRSSSAASSTVSSSQSWRATSSTRGMSPPPNPGSKGIPTAAAAPGAHPSRKHSSHHTARRQKHHHHHGPHHEDNGSSSTVVVRRVVRRRRSEVFVEEGGSLVARAPMPLSSTSGGRGRSPPRTAAAAASAGAPTTGAVVPAGVVSSQAPSRTRSSKRQ